MADLQDLKSKAVTGSLWAIVEKFSLQIVQFVVGVLLARLLEPRDFGLIAMTTIFTSLSGAIMDGGFEKTLIRKQDLTPTDINSVFFVNLALSVVMTTVLFVTAPAIAAFFKEPALVVILRVISIGLVITALGQVQRILLMKELKFKKISVVQIASSLAGGITGVTMAFAGYGVWALVYSALVAQFISVILFWIGSDWYPGLRFSWPAIREMLPYGSRILASSLLFFLMMQFNNFIVGKFYAGTELGLFNRGSRLPELIITIIDGIVLKMAFPLFSKVQDDNDQLAQVLRKTSKVVAFVAFPLLALMWVNARDITLVLFTDKWSGSIIFLEFFCVIKLFEPFVAIYRELILAKGYARLLLRIFLVTSAAEIALVLAIAHLGILYIVGATLLSKFAQYIVYQVITARKVGLPWQNQAGWVKSYLVITLVTALITKTTGYALTVWGMPLFPRLVTQLATGGLLWLLLAWLARLEELSFIRTTLQLLEKKVKIIPR